MKKTPRWMREMIKASEECDVIMPWQHGYTRKEVAAE